MNGRTGDCSTKQEQNDIKEEGWPVLRDLYVRELLVLNSLIYLDPMQRF